jgi:hypothetical protein
MIYVIAIAWLIIINFLLLRYSCDCGDSQKKSTKKKIKINTQKIWSQSQKKSDPVFADK